MREASIDQAHISPREMWGRKCGDEGNGTKEMWGREMWGQGNVREMWGNVGTDGTYPNYLVISSRSGNHKAQTRHRLSAHRVISAIVRIWLDCRALWSSTFPIMLRSGGMRDRSFSPATQIASLTWSCCESIRNTTLSRSWATASCRITYTCSLFRTPRRHCHNLSNKRMDVMRRTGMPSGRRQATYGRGDSIPARWMNRICGQRCAMSS